MNPIIRLAAAALGCSHNQAPPALWGCPELLFHSKAASTATHPTATYPTDLVGTLTAARPKTNSSTVGSYCLALQPPPPQNLFSGFLGYNCPGKKRPHHCRAIHHCLTEDASTMIEPPSLWLLGRGHPEGCSGCPPLQGDGTVQNKT